jgi:hypothetical protein
VNLQTHPLLPPVPLLQFLAPVGTGDYLFLNL